MQTLGSKTNHLPIFGNTRPDKPDDPQNYSTDKAAREKDGAVSQEYSYILCSVLLQWKIASYKEDAMSIMKDKVLLKARTYMLKISVATGGE